GRERRALRTGAAASAAGPGGPRLPPLGLRAGAEPQFPSLGSRASVRAHGDGRRIRARRGGSQAARAGRALGRTAERPAAAQAGSPVGGRGSAGGGSRRRPASGGGGPAPAVGGASAAARGLARELPGAAGTGAGRLRRLRWS